MRKMQIEQDMFTRRPKRQIQSVITIKQDNRLNFSQPPIQTQISSDDDLSSQQPTQTQALNGNNNYNIKLHHQHNPNQPRPSSINSPKPSTKYSDQLYKLSSKIIIKTIRLQTKKQQYDMYSYLVDNKEIKEKQMSYVLSKNQLNKNQVHVDARPVKISDKIVYMVK